MLRVTVDLFSGRENPRWTVDFDQALRLLQTIANAPDVIEHADPGTLGLGYRGLLVDLISDDLYREVRLPTSFRILSKAGRGSTVVEQILRTVESRPVAIDLKDVKWDELRQFVIRADREFKYTFPNPKYIDPDWIQKIIELITKYLEWLRKGGCKHEEIPFDPAFWNGPAHVGANNCYNFASNRRTDTFAQPGRASGQPAPVIDCAHVKAAAIADGLVQAPPCPPDDQAPRYLVALVQAPVFSPSWPHPDYHWYRRCSDGFWAHKPGGTPARSYDNSGNTVYDPETCDRGPYTNFCGYFYTQKKMVVS